MKTNRYKKEVVKAGIILLAGLTLGWLIFHRGTAKVAAATTMQTEGQIHRHSDTESHTTWTCAMHPWIRLDAPGKCPICGMDLIPLADLQEGDTITSDEISMSASAMKLAEIQTALVKSGVPVRITSLLGKVTPDEQKISVMTARFDGRIEKLLINFTGQQVEKGEKLATIYSPGLVTAQQELLEAIKYRDSNPALYKSARTKLKFWDLTDHQIDNLEKGQEVQPNFPILSTVSGTVTSRHVASGDYVKEGEPLFEVIDLSTVWVMFEVYENDLPWVKTGDDITFTLSALPGKKFTRSISFIDPMIAADTRIAQARIELNNQDNKLKPGMFVDGTVKSTLGPGKSLLIPKSSVLWTGKRSLVYRKVPGTAQPAFRLREVTLGPEAGENYVVESGLVVGEEIAANGVFKIDAAAQLAGKPSMMNPSGGETSLGHQHTGMDMSKSKGSPTDMAGTQPGTDMENEPGHTIPDAFKKQLTAVVDQYLILKDALVASNETAAASAATATQDALNNVNMELLTGNAHNLWMTLRKSLKENLNGIITMKGIEMKRTHFIVVSDKLNQAIKDFGITASYKLYLEFCPMANQNKGAFWISQFADIRNPYFGDKMLTCGEIKDTLSK